MSVDGLSFPSIIQLQFKRAKAICQRNAVGPLYEADEEIYVPVRPTFDPYKAGVKSVTPAAQPVLCTSGDDDDDNQDIPLTSLIPNATKSSAQVALSVEQMLVQRRSGGLKPDKSRPFHIGIRLSQNERELVVQHAEKSGLTISEYVRASVLGAGYASSIDPVKRQQLVDANRELSRQGNNLNQIAKHLNAGIASPEQGESMLDILARGLLAAYTSVRKALAEGQDGPI